MERWLRLAGDAIDPADAAYLRERRDGFAAAAAALTPHLPPGPIHGDALPRNVHVGPDGPVLVDLETFSADLREHDLVVMALSRDRYGLAADAYEAFTDGLRLGRARVGGLLGAARRPRDGQLRLGRPARADQPQGAGRVRAPGGVAAGRGRVGALVSVLTEPGGEGVQTVSSAGSRRGQVPSTTAVAFASGERDSSHGERERDMKKMEREREREREREMKTNEER